MDIFLEILLFQNKRGECKKFLDDNPGNLHITDFSLHSIGVVLFKFGKEDVFERFLDDIMPNVTLVSLPTSRYEEIIIAGKNLNFDFDDAYQFNVAKYYGLKIVTMDADFRKARDLDVIFL